MLPDKRKTVKIFIASSIIEFKEERNELVAFEARLNRLYKDSGICFEINVSELIPNCLSLEGKQEEYNIEIRKSRFVYFLIGKSIGQYTREEFRVAREQFQQSEQPLIYTYFRYDIHNPDVDESVIRFVEEDLNDGPQHYLTPFDHIDTVKLNIMYEITRHPEIGGSIGFQNGYAQLNGENAVPLKNIPIYQRNEDLAALKERYETLNSEYSAIAASLSQRHDFSVISRAYELGMQRNSLLEEIERREKKLLENYLSYVSKARYGAEMNWREKTALEFYNKGDYVSGDKILSDELWEKELAAADEIGETVVRTIHEYISGKRTLISSMLSRETNEESFRKVMALYQQLVDYSEKYQTDLDVLYAFAQFLFDQKNYKKALEVASRLRKYNDLLSVNNNTQQYDLLVLLGRLHHIYKDFTNAINCYDEAESYIMDSDSDVVMKKARLGFQRGLEYLEQKEYPESEAALRAILVDLNPVGSRKEKQLLIQTYKNLGRISNANNNFEDAVYYYREAIKLCCSINDYEQDEQLMEQLSGIYNNLGYLFSTKSNDLVAAEKYYRQSLEIKRRFFTRNPSRWVSKYALAQANMSNIFYKEERFEDAVTAAEASYAVRKGLYQIDPEAFGFGFGVTCYRLSAAKMMSGKQEDAMLYGKQSVEIIDNFYKKNPKACAEEMSIAYRRYAESLYSVNDIQAEDSFAKMVQVEADNSWMETKRMVTLYGNHLSYARFLIKVGNKTAAKEQYDIALRRISELIDINERLTEKKDELITEMRTLFNW